MRIALLLFSSLIFICTSQAQQEPCATSAHQHGLMQDADYAAAHHLRSESMQRLLDLDQSRLLNDCDDLMIIPLAIHFQDVDLGIDCALAKVQNQVQIINDAFSGTITDASLWSSIQPVTYPDIASGASCIRFCLATMNHPEGFGLAEGEPAVTMNQTIGDNEPAFAGYLNIFVRDLGGGILGYSPLGGALNGDGIIMDPAYFGSLTCDGLAIDSTYSLGRNTVHELGHYLNLNHQWFGDCIDGDDVDDTPLVNNPTYGCPLDTSFVHCTDTVLAFTYMDYVNDPCMFMFTAGQVARMEAWYTANLQTVLVDQVSTVCSQSDMQVQFIHNSPDLDLELIDIYLDDSLIIDDLAYSFASPFLQLPFSFSGIISIAPSSSLTVDESVSNYPINMATGQALIMILDGVNEPAGFDPAPPLTLETYASARLMAQAPGNTDILVHHGSTDSPLMDLTESGVPSNSLATAIDYTSFQGYSEWISDDYQLELFLADAGVSLGVFEAMLASESLTGEAVTLLISGFQDPANNNDGADLNILLARSSGGALAPLPRITGISDFIDGPDLFLYPMPANQHVQLQPVLNGHARAQIFDMQGRLVLEYNEQNMSQIDISTLSTGSYTLRLYNQDASALLKLLIQR